MRPRPRGVRNNHTARAERGPWRPREPQRAIQIWRRASGSGSPRVYFCLLFLFLCVMHGCAHHVPLGVVAVLCGWC